MGRVRLRRAGAIRPRRHLPAYGPAGLIKIIELMADDE